MIDKRFVTKMMIFQGEGKAGQRNVNLVDRGGEHVLDMLDVKAADRDIFQHMNIVIPQEKIPFEDGCIDKENNRENNSQNNKSADSRG